MLVCLPMLPLAAAPKLRISAAAIGPLTIPAGQNGAVQTIEAANFGDGALALTASSNVSWISANVGAPPARCSLRPTCAATINAALNTASLQRGKYTGVVTLNDPNAVDAPQTISITVQIGSGVPDSLDMYVPPNGSARTTFVTGSDLGTTVAQPAGQTLSIAAIGGGSFSFTRSFTVTVSSPAGTPDGDYRGSFTVSGSTNAADNKTVPVTVHVTSLPIADVTPEALQFRVAAGAAKVEKWIQFRNRGLGTLTVFTAASSAPWLTAAVQSNIVVLTADPSGLSQGTQTASVTITANARNAPFTIPVTMEVIPPGPPRTFFQGVLDNALFQPGDAVAPGGILAVTGEQFTSGAAVQAQSLPLGTALGGASVFVNGVPAPVYYVAGSHVVNSGGQINFQLPYSTPPGEALVRVDRDGQRGNTVSVQVAAAAPRLLRLSIGDYGTAVNSDGTFPIPPAPDIPSRRARTGDALVFYALGLGQTDPPATEGRAASADPLARAPGYTIYFGPGNLPGTGVAVEPIYAGLTPGFVGLYQINAVVPAEAPRGDAVPVSLGAGTVQSNRVTIAIE
jgi:uncharacterized protein (TIGR03437 family)